MVSVSFKNKVKGTPWIYGIYYYIISFIISIIKIFVKPDEKLVLFVSYGGKKYEDSPRDIYEAMQTDQRFADYKLVWAFINPSLFDIGKGHKIRIDTFQYYRTALKARVWITNVSVTRGLKFRGINTFSLNTWHGTAIKKIGEDSFTKDSFRSKNKDRRADVFLAQSNYDQKVYSSAFRIPIESVALTGFPRNDSLVNGNNRVHIYELKTKLGIPDEKKVILYAPTYRDYQKVSGNNCYFKPAINLNNFRTLLGKDYFLIVRAHHAVSKIMDVVENDFVKDFSSYPFLNDILLISDILISDYSGILFDYSVLERPIICYTYDFDTYYRERGMYMDIRKELPYANDEDSLLNCILNIDYEEMSKKTVQFKNKYVQKYGNSSKNVLDLIYRKLNHNE